MEQKEITGKRRVRLIPLPQRAELYQTEKVEVGISIIPNNRAPG